jgi:hypothetical protein
MLKDTPHIYRKLSFYASVLPGRCQSAAFPWGGFVININVATRVHRDGKDDLGCAVLILGSPEGGELVLYEAGIVLELKNGNLLVFPSWRITHLNLHYKGIRASLVCHSDKSGNGYQKSFNGWKANHLFH